jgi:hypothetical protein
MENDRRQRKNLDMIERHLHWKKDLEKYIEYAEEENDYDEIIIDRNTLYQK